MSKTTLLVAIAVLAVAGVAGTLFTRRRSAAAEA